MKDKDLFGMSNQYIAECYLTFQDIDNTTGTNEQIHLKLSRPKNIGKKIFALIEIIFFFLIKYNLNLLLFSRIRLYSGSRISAR